MPAIGDGSDMATADHCRAHEILNNGNMLIGRRESDRFSKVLTDGTIVEIRLGKVAAVMVPC